MRKFKFTKGPYEIHNGETLSIRAGGEIIATVQGEANARLFRQAPILIAFVDAITEDRRVPADRKRQAMKLLEELEEL